MKNGWRLALFSITIIVALIGFIWITLDKRVMAIETENKAIRDCMGEIRVSIGKLETNSGNLEKLMTVHLAGIQRELQLMRTGRYE